MLKAADAHLDSSSLLILGVGSMALLLLLILRLKLHPFVALLLVSIVVALAAGIRPGDLASTIEAGAGKTLGHIALILPLGAMIGRLIQRSGGATAFAHALLNRFGTTRAPLALTIAGFFLGIPVFFEVGVMILMPITYSVAEAAKKPLLVFALPMCAALLIVHAFLPPHPGPTAAAALLGADVGRMLLWGLPITAITTVVAYFFNPLITRGRHHVTSDVRFAFEGYAEEKLGTTTVNSKGSRPPEVWLIVILILTPIVLIMQGSIAQLLFPENTLALSVSRVLGIPFVALLLDVILCAYFLGVRRRWSLAEISDVIASAIPGIATVILVTGAGGIFAQVLVTSGMSVAITSMLQSTGLPILGLAFVLTLLLRAAQGPTTVAIITTAGIINPMVAAGRFSADQVALICLAMGAGGLGASHVNDAGFWIVTKMMGLTVGDGIRTWTLITTVSGLTGFALTALAWTQI